MKLRLIAIFCLTILTLKPVFAEEGMLIPSLIAAFENDMKAKGMKLSAADPLGRKLQDAGMITKKRAPKQLKVS
ncbi:MAG: hypothetical protein NWR49_02575 [Crocinitomicaceae bacterium]|nr:hypothetical protein [Crocinitomicaceae bacterium]